MSAAAEAALRDSACEIALAVDLILLSLIALFVCRLLRSGWSLKDAMSEAMADPNGTGELSFHMAASSSRFTAMIGTILFATLSGHCVGFVIGSLSVGLSPDLKWAESLFLAIGGFFAPYTANKVASAIASTSKGPQGDWKTLPPGGFEVYRRAPGLRRRL